MRIIEIAWYRYWDLVQPWMKRRLPWLDRPLMRAFHRYEIWRVSESATRLLGRRWKRSLRRIDIDITYACNLRCNDCNRSVPQALSSTSLTKRDVERFVVDTVASGHDWDLIKLAGGEPTLHPQFLEILDVLRDYRRRHNPRVRIFVCTNGYGDRVKRIIAQIPADIVVDNTAKSGSLQEDFEPFNRAPCDLAEHRRSDYTNGCWITQYCGIGLTPSGYYQCSIAGGIDRVFGLDVGRCTIPVPSDPLHDQMDALCRYCGHFCKQFTPEAQDERLTASWQKAYADWRDRSAKRRRSTAKPTVAAQSETALYTRPPILVTASPMAASAPENILQDSKE